MDRIDREPVAVLRGHGSDVNDISFIPGNPNLLLSGDADGIVKLWDLEVRRPISSARRHDPQTAGVLGVASVASPDGSCYCLTQGREGLVKCWRLRADGLDNQPVLVLRTRAFNYCRLSASPADASALFGRRASELAGASSQATTLVDEPDDSKPCRPESPSSSAGAAREAGQCLCREAPHGAPGRADTGVEAIFAVAGEDTSETEIWDLRSGTRPYVANPMPSSSTAGGPSLPGMVMAVRLFQPPGAARPMLAVGYEDGTLRVWDLRAGTKPLASAKLHQEPLLDVALNISGTSGASGGAGNELVFFDADYNKGSCKVRTRLRLGHEGVGCLAYRAGDGLLASGGWDNRVRLLDGSARRQLATFKYHSGHVTRVAFSGDGVLLASASRDTTIALWSVPVVPSVQRALLL